MKDCNSPFLDASQNIKAKKFVLKPTKFRFRLFCLIGKSQMYVNFNITFGATTEWCDTGPGASKSHEQSLTHTGCQLNSEKLFFLCLISLQTV